MNSDQLFTLLSLLSLNSCILLLNGQSVPITSMIKTIFFSNTQIKNQILLPGFKVPDKMLQLFLEDSSPSVYSQPSAASRAQPRRQASEGVVVYWCLELCVYTVTLTIPSAVIC